MVRPIAVLRPRERARVAYAVQKRVPTAVPPTAPSRVPAGRSEDVGGDAPPGLVLLHAVEVLVHAVWIPTCQ